METKQKRKQDDTPDTGKHNTQDTHGTIIYSLYTESGCWTSQRSKNRINMEKRLLKQPNSMTTKVMNNNEKGSWKETTINTILNRNTNDTQTPTPNEIIKRFQETINQKAEGKTKTQYLFNNTQCQARICNPT